MEDIENLAKGCDVEINSSRNIAQSLYRSVLAVGAGVISETDLNDVVCPTCGKYPSTVCSDGNVKNATKMPSNILFDKKEEIPDLLPFQDQNFAKFNEKCKNVVEIRILSSFNNGPSSAEKKD